MKKIIEIAAKPFNERWELLQSFSKKIGCEFEFECIASTHDNFEKDLDEVKKRADVIKIGPPFAEDVVPLLQDLNYDIQTIGACDVLEKDGPHWWPRNMLSRAFYEVLSGDVGQVDLKMTALIVGAGGACRSIFAALVRAGFTKISITDKFSEKGIETLKSIQGKFFNIKTEFVPMQAITTLPGIHSLVINTTPLLIENDLLDELYFFNFLREGGVVVDLQFVPPMTPLLQEASTWGARVLSGVFVAARADKALVKHLFNQEIALSEYREELKKKLEEIPFDSTPFINRFRDR